MLARIAPAERGPLVGGGIDQWIAYVIALIFLLVKPNGLFGQRSVERV